MIGSFHAAKCVEHCIGKFIQGGLEDALKQTKVFTVATVESILNGKHYVRSLKGLLIVVGAIEKMKWKAFFKYNEVSKYKVLQTFVQFQAALKAKNHKQSKAYYELCSNDIVQIKDDFKTFSNGCASKSEICKYWNQLINFVYLLKFLIASDREGNWEGHLQAIQSLLPLLIESGSINYVRYVSWYLEKMRKLPHEHPDTYEEFMKGKFVVKTNPGNFNAVVPDMKLEQTIQRSKKGTGGIIGQTKKDSFVTEWELVYHEVLSISNCFVDLTKSAPFNSDAVLLHHELGGHSADEFNQSLQKVASFIEERGNPYETSPLAKLYHFTTNEVVSPDNAELLLNAYEHGKAEYIAYRKARFVTKEAKLIDTIKRNSVATFSSKAKSNKINKSTSTETVKSMTKKLAKAQRNIDIAHSRGIPFDEILAYHHVRNPLFDGDQLSEPSKSDMVSEVEKLLQPDDWKFEKCTDEETAIIVDFMSTVRKVDFRKTNTFKDVFQHVWNIIVNTCKASQIDIIYDSYLEMVKDGEDGERVRRSQEHEALEYVGLTQESPIPVQLDRFCANSKNKERLQLMSRKFFAKKGMEDNNIVVLLSGYVTDADGPKVCELFTAGIMKDVPQLISSIEEADS